jgi:hypothetical protein
VDDEAGGDAVAEILLERTNELGHGGPHGCG